jgi:8-oxo-dGTP diphosphatase
MLKKSRYLQAVNCVVFGFDGENLKILLINRSFEPEKDKWSLMGGFVKDVESVDQTANRILRRLTGLDGVYLEQLHTFGNPQSETMERIISTAYVALLDIEKYQKQISNYYYSEWFSIKNMPKLIFDEQEMVDLAQKHIRYKAALHPILFELLPNRFTIPSLQIMYESVYNTTIDKRNFSKRILDSGLLIKQGEKDKKNSKRGAFYYYLNLQKYYAKFQAFLNFIPDPTNLI